MCGLRSLLKNRFLFAEVLRILQRLIGGSGSDETSMLQHAIVSRYRYVFSRCIYSRASLLHLSISRLLASILGGRRFTYLRNAQSVLRVYDSVVADLDTVLLLMDITYGGVHRINWSLFWYHAYTIQLAQESRGQRFKLVEMVLDVAIVN
ncbi:hypothetical protein Tco_1363137 [Tanacetum coccineum]